MGDLIGQRIGEWTVEATAPSDKKGNRRVVARCSCGTSRLARASRLVSGGSQSCGCKGQRHLALPVLERYAPDLNSGCWLWEGALGDAMGHGVVWSGGRGVYAHRYFYEQMRGSIPPGLLALHRCDVACCVNPDHIYIGTQAQNNKDAYDRGRNKLPTVQTRGNGFARSKLSPEKVRLIRQSTETDLVLGRRLGVTDAAIWAVRNRRSWAWVE